MVVHGRIIRPIPMMRILFMGQKGLRVLRTVTIQCGKTIEAFTALYHGRIPYKKRSSPIATSICIHFSEPGVAECPENIPVRKQGGIHSICSRKPFETGEVLV